MALVEFHVRAGRSGAICGSLPVGPRRCARLTSLVKNTRLDIAQTACSERDLGFGLKAPCQGDLPPNRTESVVPDRRSVKNSPDRAGRAPAVGRARAAAPGAAKTAWRSQRAALVVFEGPSTSSEQSSKRTTPGRGAS